MALIENAADVEGGSKEWVVEARQAIKDLGVKLEIIDLRDFKGKPQALESKLASKDVIWIGGGNTFYLRWLLRETKSDEIITKLVKNGIVYGGGSAGAIIAGPTLKHFETADDPADAPEVILDGLHLTHIVIVPHMDNSKFLPVINGIRDNLQNDGFAIAPLKDSQALVINDDIRKIIG